MYKTLSVVLVVFALFVGCSKNYNTKEELFTEGLKLMNANNPSGAIVFFKNALDKDQNFFEARLQLAKAYSSVGKVDSADKELQKVLRQSPGSRDVRVEVARVSLKRSKPDDALKEIAGLIGEGSTDAEALEIAGWAHALKGNYGASESFLKRSLSMSPAKTSAVLALGRVYLMTGNVKDARAKISEVLKQEPANRAALYTLAELDIKENNRDGALKTYEGILKAYPSDNEAFIRKGMLLLDKGAYDDAISATAEFAEKYPQNAAGYYIRGLALYYKKNLDDAIIALQKSLTLQQSTGTYYYLGLCHYSKGEFEQAMNQMQKALDLNPAFAPARVLSSLILLNGKKLDDAVSEAKRALESDDKNALAHNILGSAYMAKGMYAEGMAEFNKAIEINPKLPDVHIKKGLFELSKGKTGEAEAELKTAVRANPELLNARTLLASYYMNRGEYNKAVDTARQGIKGEPADAVLYNLLAEAMLRQNKTADAASYLHKAKEINPAYDATYFKLASLHVIKGEYDKAIQELASFVERSPDNVNALLTLASLFEVKGKDDDALKYYLRAGRTGKREGSIELAKYHLRKKEENKALRVIDAALKKSPSDDVLHEMRGRTLVTQKRFDDAVKTFEDMERINPGLGLPQIVNIYIAMKRPEKALERVGKEIKKSPARLDLRAEVSRIYKIMGKKQEAIDNANDIIRQNPESPAGYIILATVYQDDREFEKAIETLRKASRVRDAKIPLMLGTLYLAKRDYASALDQCRKAEAMKSGYVPAMFQKAAVYHTMGKRKEAIAEYSRVLKSSQNHLAALNNLAFLYGEDNRDLPTALQLAMRAYTLAPRDGSVLDTLGFVLLKNKKVDDALKALQKAAEFLPDNPTVYYHLALGYKEHGQNSLAVDNLQKALGLGDFSEAGQARALLEKLKKGARG